MYLRKWTAVLMTIFLMITLLPGTAYAENGAATEDYCPESGSGKHSWSEPEVVEEATCQNTGTQVRYCTACGYSLYETIPQMFHSYGSWEVVQEPTCTEEGVAQRVCSMCGGVDRQPVEKTDHVYGSQEITKQATCTSTGTITSTCINCGQKIEETIPVRSHSFGGWKTVKEATDFTQGVRERTCQSCGQTESMEFDPEGTLRRGDSGDEVEGLQNSLNAAGFNCGTADGIFGGMTESAVAELEAANGIEEDGIAWPGVQKLLSGSKALPATAVEGASLVLSGEAIPAQDFYEGKEIPVTMTLTNNGSETLHSLKLTSDSTDKISHESWMDGDLASGQSYTFTYTIVITASELTKDWGHRYPFAEAVSENDTNVSASTLLVFAKLKEEPSILLVPEDTTAAKIAPGDTRRISLYVFNNGNTAVEDPEFVLSSCGGAETPWEDSCQVPYEYMYYFPSGYSFIVDYDIKVQTADETYAALTAEEGGGGGFVNRFVELTAVDPGSENTLSDDADLYFWLEPVTQMPSVTPEPSPATGRDPFPLDDYFEIVKSVKSKSKESAGYQLNEQIDYLIVVTNTVDPDEYGDYRLYDIEVYDPLKGSGEDMLVGKISELGSGESAALTFSYDVQQKDFDSGKGYIENTAFATWMDPYTDTDMKEYSNTVQVTLFQPVITVTPTPTEPPEISPTPTPAEPPEISPTPTPKEPEPKVTPTPVPVTPAVFKGDVCSRTLNGKGHAVAEYTLHICESHWEAAEFADALTASAQTDEEQMIVWKEVQKIWKNEINEMYRSLSDAAKTEEERTIINNEKDRFYKSVDAYDASLELIYPEDALQRTAKIAELLMNKCADLCYEINTAPEKRVDSYLRDYQVMERGPDSPACVRTLQEKKDHDTRYHENLSMDHAVIEDMVLDLLDKAETNEDILGVWKMAVQYWKVELGQTAALRLNAADEQGKAVINEDKQAFEGWLTAREEFLKLLYPDDPEIVAEILAKTVMNRVIDYCEAMNTVG